MTPDDKLIIECECGTHLLQVSTHIDEIGQDYYFAMFNFGRYSRSIIWRLKLCWRILKTGEPYSDQLVLTNQDAKKLSDYISNTIQHRFQL
jgi:hypothetical protein